MGSAAIKSTAGRAPGCPSSAAALARRRPSHPATSAALLQPVAPRRARAAAPRRGLPHAIMASPGDHTVDRDDLQARIAAEDRAIKLDEVWSAWAADDLAQRRRF